MDDSDWIQSGGIIVALGVSAYQVWVGRREQRNRGYLEGIAGFIDDARLLIEHKELQAIYTYSSKDITAPYSELTDEQRTRVHYCDSIIARCETVWVAAERKEVPADEWGYWRSWVRQLGGSPEFRWTLNWVADDYDSKFITEIRSAVDDGLQIIKKTGT